MDGECFATNENNSNNNNQNFGIQWRQRQRWFVHTNIVPGSRRHWHIQFQSGWLLFAAAAAAAVAAVVYVLVYLAFFPSPPRLFAAHFFCSCYRITMQWPQLTHMNSPVAVWCLIWLRHDFACFFLVVMAFILCCLLQCQCQWQQQQQRQRHRQHSCTLHQIHGKILFFRLHIWWWSSSSNSTGKLLLVFILAAFLRCALLLLFRECIHAVRLFFRRCSEKIQFHPDHSRVAKCTFLPGVTVVQHLASIEKCRSTRGAMQSIIILKNSGHTRSDCYFAIMGIFCSFRWSTPVCTRVTWRVRSCIIFHYCIRIRNDGSQRW